MSLIITGMLFWMVLFFSLGILGALVCVGFLVKDPRAPKTPSRFYEFILYLYVPLLIFQLGRTLEIMATNPAQLASQPTHYLYMLSYVAGYLAVFRPKIR